MRTQQWYWSVCPLASERKQPAFLKTLHFKIHIGQMIFFCFIRYALHHVYLISSPAKTMNTLRLPTIQNHFAHQFNAFRWSCWSHIKSKTTENLLKAHIAHSNTSHPSVIPLLEPLNCFQCDIIITWPNGNIHSTQLIAHVCIWCLANTKHRPDEFKNLSFFHSLG